MKIALTDIETTGLDPTKHEIIEIGCVVFDSKTLEVLDEIDIKVRPQHIETGDPKAFAVNGYNAEEWEFAVDPRVALSDYIARTAGCNFMAYNYHFDLSFLEFAAREQGLKFEFGRPSVDLLSLAMAKVPHGKVGSWSMKTICTYFRLPPESKVHRALSGAQKEFELYKAMIKPQTTVRDSAVKVLEKHYPMPDDTDLQANKEIALKMAGDRRVAMGFIGLLLDEVGR